MLLYNHVYTNIGASTPNSLSVRMNKKLNFKRVKRIKTLEKLRLNKDKNPVLNLKNLLSFFLKNKKQDMESIIKNSLKKVKTKNPLLE